jgi:hypothetical protein
MICTFTMLPADDEADVEGFACSTDNIGGARVAPQTYGEFFNVMLVAAQTGSYCPSVIPSYNS